MKKIIFAILIATVVSGTAVSNETSTVNSNVTRSFQKEFSGAQSVSWETLDSKGIYHASFIYNNIPLNAYFDREGNLLATGRVIKQENLPMLVSKAVGEKYGQYTVLETIEFIADSETSYIVKIENEKLKMYIQARGDGSTSILKKEKKNNLAKL